MQEDEILSRAIVAEFFKDSGNRIRLNNLVSIQEEKSRRDGKIYISHNRYDVDLSRAYGYLFHQSGWGGMVPVEVSGIYFIQGNAALAEIKEVDPSWVDHKDSPPWKAARTLAIRKRNRTRCLRRLPKQFALTDGDDLLNWLENNGIEGDAVWCSICRDFFPGSDDWNLCEHCWCVR